MKRQQREQLIASEKSINFATSSGFGEDKIREQSRKVDIENGARAERARLKKPTIKLFPFSLFSFPFSLFLNTKSLSQSKKFLLPLPTQTNSSIPLFLEKKIF